MLTMYLLTGQEILFFFIKNNNIVTYLPTFNTYVKYRRKQL